MDTTAVILGTVFILGVAGAFLFWDELPQGGMTGAIALDAPELQIDQQELNLCMNSCMRSCVTDFGMESRCLDICNPQCGV